MLVAGSGRLWARSTHYRQFEREPKFCFFVMRITHGFADFPSDKFYDISTQQRRSVSPCKRLEQNFTTRSRYFQKKNKNCSHIFQVLRLQAIITPQYITKAGNSRLNGPPTVCPVSIFTVRINSKSFPRVASCAPKAHPPNVFKSNQIKFILP